MKTQEYVKSLIRHNGLPKALAIATRSKENSSPENWAVVPKGKIFSDTTGPRAEGTYSSRDAVATHAFWTEVKGLLQKIAQK